MARFGKKTKTSAQIPTAALPDIIFILLFFFMVATKPKKTDPLVSAVIPFGTQLKGIDKEKAEIDLYIGYPKNAAKFGTEPMVEVGKKLYNVGKVDQVIRQQIGKLPSDKRRPTKIFIYITVDQNVNYSVLYEVKEKLKAAGIRSITYSVKKENKG